MTDIFELSSDTDDTIILENDETPSDNREGDIQSIVDKYILENCLEVEPENKQHSNYREDTDEPFIKRLKKVDDNFLPQSISDSSSSKNEIETLQMLSAKYKHIDVENQFTDIDMEPQTSKEAKKLEKELRKKEKELQKQQKLEERNLKKKEVEQEKCLKQALAAANKNTKPTECMKFITVVIDNDLMSERYCNDITSTLQTSDVQHKIESKVFPRCITWTRKVQSHLINDNGKLVLSSKEEDSDELILIMNCKEFVEHVNNDTLCVHIQTLKSVLINKKIILVIYGLQSYNRFQKNQKRHEWRDEEERETTTKSFFKDFPKVNKQSIEYALTELQLLCSCSHRLVDSGPELGALVAQFTKAVAEIPYKHQKYEKLQQTDWFAAGDNRDSVKVDKNGNGLNRLWNQTLTTFPLARLETAEAISSKYPTVSSLMKAYDECASVKDAESLLQDILIRRAAGPLSSTRRIGPELSKKVSNFFTSVDGETLL